MADLQNLTSYTPAIWEPAFLKVLRQTGNVSESCRTAKIERQTAYDRRKAVEEFARLWDDAKAEYSDALELEADRRARLGVLKPVYQRGEKVGTIREYSDTLMLALLKANLPDKYRERQEIKFPDGPMVVAVTKMDVDKL